MLGRVRRSLPVDRFFGHRVIINGARAHEGRPLGRSC
jgi:hypothetical protein